MSWNEPTVPLKILRFDEVEIRTASHEVFVSGVPVSLTPRSYELLLYLIDQRHRVVAKDELLQTVWRTTSIFEGVIAKAVMNIRNAFRAAGNNARFIRTAHRVGYQFIGRLEVVEEGRDGNVRTIPPVLQTTSAPNRLALLPFQNLTGDEGMSWIELGLMAMAGKVIAAAGTILVAPPQETILALAGVVAKASFDARVHAVERVTGIRDIAAVTVSGEPGQYQLNWTLRNWRGEFTHGVQEGSEVTRLALQCAEQIAAAIRPHEAANVQSVFHIGDEFENQAFARALQAIEEERYRVALNLLHLCSEVEPHPVEVDLEYLHVLSEMSDPRTEAWAERVLARLGPTHTAMHRSRVLMSRAEYLFRDNESSEKAALLAEEASRVLAPQGASEMLVSALLLRARIALVARRLEEARAFLNQALSTVDRMGNQLLLAKVYVQVGNVESAEGNLPAAIACFERGVDLSRRANLHAQLANCLASLSFALSRSGCYERAHQVAEEALTISRQGGSPGVLAQVLCVLCVNCIVRGRHKQAESILMIMETAEFQGHPLGKGYTHYLRASLSMARNQMDAAREHFMQAEVLLRKYPGPWLNFILPARIDFAIRNRDFDKAERLITEYTTHPRFSSDRRLQACACLSLGLLCAERGDRRAALVHLHRGVEKSYPDEIYAQMAGRAIWFHLDHGEIEQAKNLLTLIAPWTDENPAALAVRARVMAATGDFSAALSDQDQCIERLGEHVPPHIYKLREAYARAVEEGADVEISPSVQFLRPF